MNKDSQILDWFGIMKQLNVTQSKLKAIFMQIVVACISQFFREPEEHSHQKAT
jgi:uncharacterized membrane protein YwzB